jgi:hypothetical protein
MTALAYAQIATLKKLGLENSIVYGKKGDLILQQNNN